MLTKVKPNKQVQFQNELQTYNYAFPCHVCDYETARKRELEDHLFNSHRIRMSFTHVRSGKNQLLMADEPFQKHLINSFIDSLKKLELILNFQNMLIQCFLLHGSSCLILTRKNPTLGLVSTHHYGRQFRIILFKLEIILLRHGS